MAQRRYMKKCPDTLQDINSETTSSTTVPIKGAKSKPKEDTSSTVKYGGNDKKLGSKVENIKSPKIPNIKTLEHYILQSIIGQDTQVRQIITAIYRALYFKSIKANVLIIGNSGTGKTAIIKEIAKKLDIPFTIEDATKYTQEGYYGSDVSEMIYNLIENAKFDLKKAESGIIVIDEIDKKSSTSNEIGRDISGNEVLKSLLKLIEGTTISLNDFPFDDDNDISFSTDMLEFNTSNVIFIFLGAFSGLDKIRDKRISPNSMGFVEKQLDSQSSNIRYSKDDLIKYGMPTEFIGRIDTLVEMNALTSDDLVTILKKSKLSIFRRYQEALKQKGISLSYNGKIFRRIAEKSIALNTGARELSNTVNYIFENILYEILANPNKYTKCKLCLDIVDDNTKYELS